MKILMKDTGAIVSDEEFRALFPNVSFPAVLPLEAIRERGGEPILASPLPTYKANEKVVLRGAKQDSKGNWVEDWSVVPLALSEDEKAAILEQKKDAAKSRIKQIFNEKLDAGFAFSFTKKLGGRKVFQIHEVDRLNWLSVMITAQTFVAAGKGSEKMDLRTADNSVVTIPAQQALDVIFALQKHFLALQKRAWVLKDAIAGASSVEEIEALDLESIWPE